jgi:hypothetical protein
LEILSIDFCGTKDLFFLPILKKPGKAYLCGGEREVAYTHLGPSNLNPKKELILTIPRVIRRSALFYAIRY